MREIMISIQPQWVEKILNGEKTIEIRKTMPKCELPVKVYIYCTKNEKQYFSNVKCCESLLMDSNSLGKVVAEFICKRIDEFDRFQAMEHYPYLQLEKSCLSVFEINKYIGNKKGFGWHIDNLKIYDKPKELSEFSHYIKDNKCLKKECGINCEDCSSYDEEHNTCLALYYSYRQIKRPPQSWCYVEEVSNE